MDKLKKVLNPGFKEQDELLYDTGSSKEAQDTSADTAGETSRASITNDPKTAVNTTSAASDPTSGTHGHPIDTTTSRTAVNQKEHMAPYDFTAASHTLSDKPSETQPASQPATSGAGGVAATQSHSTQHPHSDNTARNATIGAGATAGAAGFAHHEHQRHHDSQIQKAGAVSDETVDDPKEKPSIIKKILSIGKKDDGEQSAEHYSGATVMSSSSQKKQEKEAEHTEKKEHGLLDKILHPGSKKHDESSHEKIKDADTLHNQPRSQEPSDQLPANASVGGAQTAAPVGAGAVGAVFAAHEMKKHDRGAKLQQSHSKGTSHQAGGTNSKTVEPFGLSTSGTTTSRSTAPVGAVGSSTSTTGQASHSQHAGTVAAGSAAATAAAATAYATHEHGSNAQSQASQQNSATLTHHQHNTGGVLSHGQTAGHEHQHSYHDRSHVSAAAATSADEARNHSDQVSGHEQRDLHQHGADSGLSHHVHNGVTALPHHSHDHGKHTAASGTAQTSQISQIANADHGPASNTKGPHSSNVLNVLDPRVKPDVGAIQAEKEAQTSQSQIANANDGPASKTKGPHDSNILNILDPRVRPDVGAIQAEKETSRARDEGLSSITAGTTQDPPSLHLPKGAPPMTPTSASDLTPKSAPTGDASRSIRTDSTPVAHQRHETLKSTTSTSEKSNVPLVAQSGGTIGNDYGAEHAGRDRVQEAALTNKARNGEARPRVAVASAKDAESVGIEPQKTADTVAAENSGAAGTHNEPAHTDNVKGIVSGEGGDVGDSSNVYSRKPLDDRVNMPGSFPEIGSNIT